MKSFTYQFLHRFLFLLALGLPGPLVPSALLINDMFLAEASELPERSGEVDPLTEGVTASVCARSFLARREQPEANATTVVYSARMGCHLRFLPVSVRRTIPAATGQVSMPIRC